MNVKGYIKLDKKLYEFTHLTKEFNCRNCKLKQKNECTKYIVYEKNQEGSKFVPICDFMNLIELKEIKDSKELIKNFMNPSSLEIQITINKRDVTQEIFNDIIEIQEKKYNSTFNKLKRMFKCN